MKGPFAMSPRRASARRALRASLLCLPLLLAALPLSPLLSVAAPQAAVAGPKLLLAFYYMWYGPSDFDRGQMPDHPVASYISDHADVIDRQVREAQGAGIDAFISSWEGAGTETDVNFPKLLDTAARYGFHATTYFETNFAMQHGDVVSQLKSIVSRFSNHPAFLRWNGKPVLFIWSPQALGGPSVWKSVRQQVDPGANQIWSVDTTDPAYLDAFDTVHLFSGGKWNAGTDVARVDAQWRGITDAYNSAHGASRLWTAGVIPGWDESRVQPPRPAAKVFPRDGGAAYEANWRGALASNPEWITITSYNEWFEGTQIEPSSSYGARYLDLTRQYAQQWKGVPAAAPPAPPAGGQALVAQTDPCDGGTLFPQTGKRLCKQMESYWTRYGGVAQFGYPISDPGAEASAADGKTYTVQYFERARFELHPEHHGTPYEVQLGLVGRQFHPNDPPVAALNDGAHTFFKETGHNVSASFYSYWQQHGGLFVNGYPISEELTEASSDGKTYRVQYFERARFELHPENAAPFNVLLGVLGWQAWSARGGH
jgi:hypothetical protein